MFASHRYVCIAFWAETAAVHGGSFTYATKPAILYVCPTRHTKFSQTLVHTAPQVSAVSTKRHTTRENTLGVMTVGKAQIFFHDTPGFVSHKERQDYKPALSAASREAIGTVNLTLLLVDASKDIAKRGLRSLTGLLEEALRSPCELFLVLNKVDMVNPRHRLLETTDEIMDRAQEIMDKMDEENLADATPQERKMKAGSAAASGEEEGYCSSGDINSSSSSSGSAGHRRLFRDGGKTVDDHITVFMVSAKTGDGVMDIVDFLEHRARPGAWLFGRDETTNKDKRSRLHEIVREGLFKHLYKELPYQIQTHTRYARMFTYEELRPLQIFPNHKNHQFYFVRGAGTCSLYKRGESPSQCPKPESHVDRDWQETQ